MTFLSPIAIGVAAAVTVPPLILLYFLKLKRSVRLVPSTLLWRRTVEDLQVNSPFQRLRSNLLLILQLLILVGAAFALGQPMFQAVEAYEGTLVFLVDQSASMGIVEADGVSRLDRAKEQAKLRVDKMSDDARAMVIAFSDRATVVSSFDTDRRALKRKIDAIPQTQSRSALGEAVRLAEAYTQNIIIGTEEAGGEIAPQSPAPAARVFVFTDGRIEDAADVALQRFEVDRMHMVPIGERGDNVGIVAMDARRHYEHSEILEVAASVRNFGPADLVVDAVLYVDGRNVDIKTVELPAERGRTATRGPGSGSRAVARSVKVIAFDDVEFVGSGVVEVVLRVDDALSADNRAWTIIEEPRRMRVLLVADWNPFLQNVLSTLPVELTQMTGEEYEQADEDELSDGARSVYDVVIFDGHSTDRLPQGNYFFWGAVPEVEGVAVEGTIDDQVIFNWDDTHPVLRHVGVEGLYVFEWLELSLPPETVSLVDGETSPVLAYFTRDASQFLICAFKLVYEDGPARRMNTHWVTSVDFVVFMQNALQYLAASVTTTGRKSVAPGEPVSLPLPERADSVRIHRPDGVADVVPASGHQTMHYARTRDVGVYRVDPGVEGHDVFAVNLFDAVESAVQPAAGLALGADSVGAQTEQVEVNRPAWPYVLLGVLALLVIEWVVYNQRVLV